MLCVFSIATPLAELLKQAFDKRTQENMLENAILAPEHEPCMGYQVCLPLVSVRRVLRVASEGEEMAQPILCLLSSPLSELVQVHSFKMLQNGFHVL